MDKKRISKKKMQENRMRQYISIINSPEYREQLTEMAKRIVKLSETAPNEATIESNFDCELFAFFREKSTLSLSQDIPNMRCSAMSCTVPHL